MLNSDPCCGKTLHCGMREMNATNVISGFSVRPGLFLTNGATIVPGGISFTIHSVGATGCELCLFRRTEQQPYAVLPFPEQFRIGNTWSMIVFGLDITEFEYAYRMDGPYDPARGLLFDKNRFLLDPYARAVTGQSRWGVRPASDSSYHARVVEDVFDWGDFEDAHVPFQDMIIYEMHVRGFTMHESSQVEHPGTFAGLMEKLPYLKELGINTVELMPAFASQLLGLQHGVLLRAKHRLYSGSGIQPRGN